MSFFQILGDYYVLRHRRIAKRSLERSEEHHVALSNEPQVSMHDQLNFILLGNLLNFISFSHSLKIVCLQIHTFIC